jgi:hypothetical protein
VVAAVAAVPAAASARPAGQAEVVPVGRGAREVALAVAVMSVEVHALLSV